MVGNTTCWCHKASEKQRVSSLVKARYCENIDESKHSKCFIAGFRATPTDFAWPTDSRGRTCSVRTEAVWLERRQTWYYQPQGFGRGQYSMILGEPILRVTFKVLSEEKSPMKPVVAYLMDNTQHGSGETITKDSGRTIQIVFWELPKDQKRKLDVHLFSDPLMLRHPEQKLSLVLDDPKPAESKPQPSR